MKTNQEFKNAALAALQGNWAPVVVGAIFYVFAVSVLISPAYSANMAAFGMAPFVAMNPALAEVFSYSGIVINILLLYPLSLGYFIAHNDLFTKGDARVTRNTIGNAFRGYWRNVWAMFLMYLFTILWTLLLIIPGIIKAFAYALTPYIIKDNPELSANQAINLSVKMMKGHKFDLFWLYLSFIGWFFLCLITLGIGFLWLMPYMQTATAAFYQDVKTEYITNNI